MEVQPLNEKGLVLLDPLARKLAELRQQDPINDRKHIVGCNKIDRRKVYRPQIMKKKKQHLRSQSSRVDDEEE